MADAEDENGHVRPGIWRNDAVGLDRIEIGHSNNSTKEAIEIRNKLATYFVTVDPLPWQHAVATRGFE